jgi:putative oxidoreductase
MTMQAGESHELIAPSPAMFALADSIAVRFGDLFVLAGRVFVAWLFIASAAPAIASIEGFVGYLTALKVPSPYFFAWLGILTEALFALALLFGVATRYAAVVGLGYVVIATLLAHRYWEYPPNQQINQYNHFLKNVAVFGGLFWVFVTGAGRYSVDGWLRRNGR